MSQIFSRQFDLVFRLSLAGGLALTAGLVAWWHMALAPAVAAPLEQPVPFSHKHHVGDVGLDCRFCHSTVDTSAYAEMPSTEVCMTCHAQLFADAEMLAPVRESWQKGTPMHWNRVYELPDFVFFDHSIHVREGVGCVNCHGRVDRMPLTAAAHALTMAWCLDCHRHPQPSLRTPQEIYAMDSKPLPPNEAAKLMRTNHMHSAQRLSDCSTCHR